MNGHFVVIAGPDQGKAFPLEEGQVLQIGRGQESGTRLTDPQVSRAHCQVKVEGGKVLVTHLSKTGSTLVAGKAVTQHELRAGDVIQIGNSQLRWQAGAAPDAST